MDSEHFLNLLLSKQLGEIEELLIWGFNSIEEKWVVDFLHLINLKESVFSVPSTSSKSSRSIESSTKGAGRAFLRRSWRTFLFNVTFLFVLQVWLKRTMVVTNWHLTLVKKLIELAPALGKNVERRTNEGTCSWISFVFMKYATLNASLRSIKWLKTSSRHEKHFCLPS